MTTLKRIAPASAFKVGLVTHGILGLFLGALCSVVVFAGVQLGPHSHMPFGAHVGIFAVIFCPIFYGLVGGIGAGIGAVLYNLRPPGWAA